jgi:hypothetical protein
MNVLRRRTHKVLHREVLHAMQQFAKQTPPYPPVVENRDVL